MRTSQNLSALLVLLCLLSPSSGFSEAKGTEFAKTFQLGPNLAFTHFNDGSFTSNEVNLGIEGRANLFQWLEAEIHSELVSYNSRTYSEFQAPPVYSASDNSIIGRAKASFDLKPLLLTPKLGLGLKLATADYEKFYGFYGSVGLDTEIEKLVVLQLAYIQGLVGNTYLYPLSGDIENKSAGTQYHEFQAGVGYHLTQNMEPIAQYNLSSWSGSQWNTFSLKVLWTL